jgi:hypothetical protein
LSLARASCGVRVPSVLSTCRKGADLKEKQIPESEIDTAGAVMHDIILRAQDKKNDKWDVIFDRCSRGLCECTVVANQEQIRIRLGIESEVLLPMSYILIQYATASPISQ